MTGIDRIERALQELVSNDGEGKESTFTMLASSGGTMLKELIDHANVRAVETIIVQLFDVYEVEPAGTDFSAIARYLLDGKVTIAKLLAKIKETREKELNDDHDDVDDEQASDEPEVTPEPAAPIVQDPEPEPVADSASILFEGDDGNIVSTISDSIIPDMRDLIAWMGGKVAKILDKDNFDKFWADVLGYVNTEKGIKLINEYGGIKPYFVVSLGLIGYKRIFESNKELRKTKDEFHALFDQKCKNAIRSLVIIREDGYTY